MLKKLEKEYDPRDKWQALRMLEDAQINNWLITGLIYVAPETPTLFDFYNIPETPLNRTPNDKLRPTEQDLEEINRRMF